MKSRRPRLQILTCLIFQFYFQKTRAFIEEDNPPEKVVVVEEGLDGIDIYNIGNLEDSPRFVFIDEECENLIVINDGGERPRNINQKKKSDVLQQSVSNNLSPLSNK